MQHGTFVPCLTCSMFGCLVRWT